MFGESFFDILCDPDIIFGRVHFTNQNVYVVHLSNSGPCFAKYLSCLASQGNHQAFLDCFRP